MDTEVYGKYNMYENGRNVLYVVVLRYLYGMLVSYLLQYKNFRCDLKEIGFELNPYEPCVVNRTENKKQNTVRFYVSNLMSSHIDTEVNNLFLKFLNNIYVTYG